MLEDTPGIFKPEAKVIKKVFGDSDSFYQIPDYQRPYSWGDEHIEQLWDDLYTAMESNDQSYFLGPLILIKSKDGYEVVDGQQRLTTLTILFCVIRDLYGSKIETVLKARIQDAIMSVVANQYRLKLITQPHHQVELENEILNEVKFPERELPHKEREQKKFINAALIFKDKLQELEEKGGMKLIEEFIDYIFKKVEMITITCSDQRYAIKLFQILNTRGLDLTPSDLIKSHLYGRLESEKRKGFIASWQEVEILSSEVEESLTDLFTYYQYYLLAQNPKHSLYEELTAQFKSKEPTKIIYDFKKFVKCFQEIFNLESKIILPFWYLPNQVFWKTILTTAKKEGYDEFDKLCQELRRMYYLYWIAGYTTSKIKQLSFNIIGWVKEKKKIDEIKREIDKKMTDDNVFRYVYDNLDDDVYNKSWIKSLLAVIEYYQTDDAKIFFIELDNKLHIDHILPIGWESKEDWQKLWKKDQAEKWLNKIGNLTLLSGKKNMVLRNEPPLEKAEVYKKGFGGKTAFEITKNIIEKLESGSWTEKDVQERQYWMIEQIKTIFHT